MPTFGDRVNRRIKKSRWTATNSPSGTNQNERIPLLYSGKREKSMRKISRKEIVSQVRKEYKIARQWCRQDFGRYYKMMIDIDDGEIWSDVFLTTNDWKEYHSDSIVTLDTESGYVHEMEDAYIEDAIRNLRAAGWDITE